MTTALASAVILVHVVISGDTLGEIARDYDTTVAAIAADNGIANVDLIHVGDELRIRGSDQQDARVEDGRNAGEPAAALTPSTAPDVAMPAASVASVIAQWFPDEFERALRVATCESGLNPAVVSASGTYHGLFQFDLPTWTSVGGVGLPSAAPVSEQAERARILRDRRGWQPWPYCGRQ